MKKVSNKEQKKIALFMEFNSLVNFRTKIQYPPRTLPLDATPKAAEINELLLKAIDFQSSKTNQHSPFLMFNGSFNANAMIWHYLRNTRLVQDHEMKLIYGCILMKPGLEVGLPHFWLEINGHIVDNMNFHNGHSKFEERTLDMYIKECPTMTEMPLLGRNTRSVIL